MPLRAIHPSASQPASVGRWSSGAARTMLFDTNARRG
jgi:hypothetical protein